MAVALSIAFRGVTASDAVERQIHERVDGLERIYDRIISCKVVLEESHRRHQQGNLFHVRISIIVPGREIVVNRDPGAHHAHEDAHVAIRDAFDAARRQLEDYARVRDGAVKSHEAPSIGRVVSLFPEQDYGFLSTETAGEIYFHRHAVPNGSFAKLVLGDRVRYVLAPEPGEKGPQASTVIPI